MTRRLAVIALLAATAGLASCDRKSPSESTADDAGAARADVATPIATADDAPKVTSAPVPAGETIDGAPTFAVLYPGATVETTPLMASAEDGVGGGVVFSSNASPDAIIDFYRAKAEAAGMTQIMAMNNGDTRAYAATKSTGGASLSVVARPLETGETSAQLTWAPGQ